MSTVRKGGNSESWVWDYFSIKDNSISMSVCDICGKEERHRIRSVNLKDMRKHLSTHKDIYNIDRRVIHWESHFERVQCSTDSINGNIKCQYCNEYNNILLRVSKGSDMESHLYVYHNVTITDWNYLENWRDRNTEDYYEVTRRPTESIKRTRLCKQCNHQFRRSNLCIMLKHLIQVHNRIPDVPLEKLPQGLLQSNYPIVDASSNQQLPTSGTSDSSLQESARLLMAELASFMDKYNQ